ncbi:MAG: hypothetical protein V8Q54_01690, partial [Alistipes senegalensis]
LASAKYYADDLRFWLDLLSQSEKLLLDSMRFNKACDDLGPAPKTVARQILFESEKTAKRVLIEGVETVLGERVKDVHRTALRGREETLCQQQFQCAGDAERSKRYVWFGGSGLTLLGFRDTFSLGRCFVSMMGTQTKQKHLEGWQSTSGDCGIAPLAFCSLSK